MPLRLGKLSSLKILLCKGTLTTVLHMLQISLAMYPQYALTHVGILLCNMYAVRYIVAGMCRLHCCNATVLLCALFAIFCKVETKKVTSSGMALLIPPQQSKESMALMQITWYHHLEEEGALSFCKCILQGILLALS